MGAGDKELFQCGPAEIGMNADVVGLLLVLGLPIAWHLRMFSRSLMNPHVIIVTLICECNGFL